jgi:hypothetical protein
MNNRRSGIKKRTIAVEDEAIHLVDEADFISISGLLGCRTKALVQQEYYIKSDTKTYEGKCTFG